MSKSFLKPCPFCGGKAGIVKDGGYYIVECYKCRTNSQMSITAKLFPDKDNSKVITDKMAIDNAVKHWNDRIT